MALTEEPRCRGFVRDHTDFTVGQRALCTGRWYRQRFPADYKSLIF